VNISV